MTTTLLISKLWPIKFLLQFRTIECRLTLSGYHAIEDHQHARLISDCAQILQIYVDMTMTNDDFEQLRSVVKHHVDSDEVDLTGRFACNNYGQADPMKLKIGIFFE